MTHVPTVSLTHRIYNSKTNVSFLCRRCWDSEKVWRHVLGRNLFEWNRVDLPEIIRSSDFNPCVKWRIERTWMDSLQPILKLEGRFRRVGAVDHRLNMVDFQNLFGLHVTWCAQLYLLAGTPQPPLSPSIGTRLRGPYWSAKIDDISL